MNRKDKKWTYIDKKRTKDRQKVKIQQKWTKRQKVDKLKTNQQKWTKYVQKVEKLRTKPAKVDKRWKIKNKASKSGQVMVNMGGQGAF